VLEHAPQAAARRPGLLSVLHLLRSLRLCHRLQARLADLPEARKRRSDAVRALLQRLPRFVEAVDAPDRRMQVGEVRLADVLEDAQDRPAAFPRSLSIY